MTRYAKGARRTPPFHFLEVSMPAHDVAHKYNYIGLFRRFYAVDIINQGDARRVIFNTFYFISRPLHLPFARA